MAKKTEDVARIAMMDALAAPFTADEVDWRIGSTTQDKTKGMALGYIDVRVVRDRLTQVCGAFGWQSKHHISTSGSQITCEIGIKDPVSGEWIWKSDGAGQSDVEGEKGGYSDATKRAAVSWGVGRYLYDLGTPWVQIEPYGRSYRIPVFELDRLKGTLIQKTVQKLNVAPAKFWDRPSLMLALPQKYIPTADGEQVSDDALIWVAEKIIDGIEKAPTRELLDKFIKSNTQWFARLPEATVQMITENQGVRLNQFETIEGK